MLALIEEKQARDDKEQKVCIIFFIASMPLAFINSHFSVSDVMLIYILSKTD